MEAVFVVIAGTFLLCWLVDKGFNKLFRNMPQHKSGKAVRLGKGFSLGGLLLTVLGLVAVIVGAGSNVLLLIGGCLLTVLGLALAVYYLSFGIFYDEDGFVLASFGKKSTLYRYSQITGQQLYNVYGKIAVELYLDDGRAVQLQAGMRDVYPFLDKAFARWLEQRGLEEENCPFHDPQNSCWFPPVEG